MNITAKEIAAKLGVSRQAVYSVLSDKPICHVSPEKREKILFLARAYHYRPNAAALHLNGKRTHRICAVVDSYAGINSMMLCRLAARLAADNYQLSTVSFMGVQQGLDAIADFVSSGADGIVYHHNYVPAEQEQIGIPSVAIGTEIEHDHALGARLAAEHLIREHGHRKLLLSVSEPGAGNPKYQGYCDALADAGLKPLPLLHTIGNRDFEKQIMNAIKHGVTAIICLLPDFMTYFLRMRGIRVPEDVAVAGYERGILMPGIATIRYDKLRLGMKIGELMLKKIREKELDPVPRELIPPIFCPDASCGCPAQNISNFAYSYDLDKPWFIADLRQE